MFVLCSEISISVTVKLVTYLNYQGFCLSGGTCYVFQYLGTELTKVRQKLLDFALLGVISTHVDTM